MTEKIPLIIINFNQLSYLRNLINQFKFYYPNNPVHIVDNGSTYAPLLEFYEKNPSIKVARFTENKCVDNLRGFLDVQSFSYYAISDPDISIHPATPPNFLEIFKELIISGFHHAGFDLITEDIPSWNKRGGWIQGDEKALHNKMVSITYDGQTYTGFRAPIDTTFCLYSSENGGWQAPMKPEHWDNSVRMFKAFHLPWYLHPEYVNEEMRNYFATCLKRDDSLPSAGRNHYSV